MANANVNANILAEQHRAERDRRRRIVAGLPQGAGATTTFLSQAARMLLDSQDAIEDEVVIVQGMGDNDDPDQIQALAAFNTGLNTVYELFGYESSISALFFVY
jgi:hypothetical protein